ncbi:putative DNA ligase-like protein [Thalictrum thalictroides]|uniref:Putative DNA ligase-like protein n=1 Tax=Thalictrum thalictroides TaxID=46969 RepID=A0A7J6WBT9_THATH|nr:putative DNA ligase-like protein [Thalictrum thalictroides]
MQGGGSILALSPSFNSYSCKSFAEIAAKVSEEFSEQRDELGLQQLSEMQKSSSQLVIEDEQIQIPCIQDEQKEEEEEEKNSDCSDDDGGDEDDDFEFAVLTRDPESSPISADEIFSNGQIKPIYPVFNRDLLFAGGQDDFTKLQNGTKIRFPLKKLLIEEREPSSSSSSESDELETLPEGTYCVWTPKPVKESPEMCKKSNSTGSSKRWRFRDLLHRSNSDGKDTFVFLTPSTKKKEKKVENVDKSSEVSKEKRDSGEMKVAGKMNTKRNSGEGTTSAHEVHYVRNRALKESDRRKSYLPYRQDLVGLFANVNMNGLNRTLRPF